MIMRRIRSTTTTTTIIIIINNNNNNNNNTIIKIICKIMNYPARCTAFSIHLLVPFFPRLEPQILSIVT